MPIFKVTVEKVEQRTLTTDIEVVAANEDRARITAIEQTAVDKSIEWRDEGTSAETPTVQNVEPIEYEPTDEQCRAAERRAMGIHG